MACPKCSVPVNNKNDSFVMCQGSCIKPFHASCVGLPEAIVKCSMKNVIWLCDDCLEIFYKQTCERIMQDDSAEPPKTVQSDSSKHDSDLAQDLTDMKRDIANIMEKLSAISENQKQPLQCAPCHSTPINSPTSNKSNSDDSHSSSNRSSSSASSVRNNDGTFSLFLSNIDVNVSEEAICTMVSRSLDVKEVATINVKKLVPKWKSTDTLNYISFKVRIGEVFKPTALRADTWPAGITYREFVERPRNAWKPID